MAYCFKRKESIPKAIRRIGNERVLHAFECVADCRQGEAIHSARKDIKKIRALLRLVRAETRGREFGLITKRLRKTAQLLAEPRDAYIKLATLTSLSRHFKGQLAPRALRHIRAELRKDFEDEMRSFAKKRTARAIRRRLGRVQKQLKCLEVPSKGWKALREGVRTAYLDGRQAYQSALKTPSSKNFHEWRKRAKDLWYQVTLMRRIWPEQMDALARDLDMLGEHLGDDHDLVMLRHALQKMCIQKRQPLEVEVLHGLVEERQRELRDAALAIGTRFYAEKPAAFCNRLAGYWKVWANKKKVLQPAR